MGGKIDEAIAEVRKHFPDAKVVSVKDAPPREEGIELWRRKWRYEDNPRDWRKDDHAFAAELDAVQQEGYRAAFFAQLKQIAMKMGRKPGWAAYFYKSVHGEWPDRRWDNMLPMAPSAATLRVVEAYDSLFRHTRKKEQERLAREAEAEVEKTLEEVEKDG